MLLVGCRRAPPVTVARCGVSSRPFLSLLGEPRLQPGPIGFTLDDEVVGVAGEAIDGMVGMAKPVSINLSATTATTLRKPIRGRGGFQSLLRRLQGQLDGRQLDVSPADAERLRRYSAAYGGGGFQRRTKGAVP